MSIEGGEGGGGGGGGGEGGRVRQGDADDTTFCLLRPVNFL